MKNDHSLWNTSLTSYYLHIFDINFLISIFFSIKQFFISIHHTPEKSFSSNFKNPQLPVWPIPYTSANLKKYRQGTNVLFCKNTGKNTSADSHIRYFKNGNNCYCNSAITQLLDGPFNGRSGLFKLELLSSDSYIRREITKKCASRTIVTSIKQAKSQKNTGVLRAIFSSE